jgi:uncharacterized protein (DUF1697 family)
MTYKNGNIYDGEWKDNKQNGKGKMTYKNGDIYDGYWEDNKKYDGGKMTYANGDIYDGDWNDDNKYGIGEMTYANGDIYFGDWEDNKKNGDGEMTYVNGDIYEGDWYENERHGYGVMNYANGNIDDGDWEHDVFINQNPRVVEEPNGVAYEIHNASHKININKYLQLIDVNSNITYNNFSKEEITNKIKETFKPLINDEEKINKLNTILEKLFNSHILYNPQYKNIIGKTIDFVILQSTEFIDFYINVFIHDCYYAYDTVPEGGGLSCVEGIVERFYMLIGDTVYALCPENCEKEIYTELLKVFGKKVDINNFTQEWANTYLSSEEIQKMTETDRKEHYINFMKQKYNELNMLDEITEQKINEEAEKISYVFKSLEFGGGRKRRKTIKKIRKIKKSRKTKKIRKPSKNSRM